MCAQKSCQIKPANEHNSSGSIAGSVSPLFKESLYLKNQVMRVRKVPLLGKTNDQKKAQQTRGNPIRTHDNHNLYRWMEPLFGGETKTIQNKTTAKNSQQNRKAGQRRFICNTLSKRNSSRLSYVIDISFQVGVDYMHVFEL